LPKAVKVSREEELLRNAIQLFSRGGFRETSPQEIADVTPVSLRSCRPAVCRFARRSRHSGLSESSGFVDFRHL